MKKLAAILFSLGLFLSLSSNAQEMPTWDLARDLQISFTQGANGVWYFMESQSFVHDPALYRLLPRYLNPCQSEGVVYAGIGCWQGSESPLPQPGFCCGLRTEVAFNFINKLVGFSGWDEGAKPGYLPHSARLAPNWQRLVIVAWQSPITGTVKVSSRFGERSDQFALGMSVGWSVEKGNQILRSGRIGVGHEDRGLGTIPRLQVAKNDVFYFIVDNSWYADAFEGYPVDLQVTITQLQ